MLPGGNPLRWQVTPALINCATESCLHSDLLLPPFLKQKTQVAAQSGAQLLKICKITRGVKVASGYLRGEQENLRLHAGTVRVAEHHLKWPLNSSTFLMYNDK